MPAVWVPDSSSLIRIKQVVPAGQQWDCFKLLETMVDSGDIAMPRQVIGEMSVIAHPDAPGIWAQGMRDRLTHPLDADFVHVAQVMSVAGDVIEANSTTDRGDPYVLALALELTATGYDPTVVTDDFVDRLPIKISIETACGRLNLKCIRCEAWLAALGLL